MLLEFGFRNYFSFKEGVSISFRLDAHCPSSISQGKSFTPVLCLKGANASGKTNILRGLSFISGFVAHSFTSKPGTILPIASHFESKETSDFFVEFMIGDVQFAYELSVTEEAVKRETLYRTISKKTKIIERIDDEITFATKEFVRLKAMTLRSNASMASTSNQYGFDELSDIHKFFNGIVSNVHFGGMQESPIDNDKIAEYLYNNKPMFSFVKRFIKECDSGVSDIDIFIADSKEVGKRYVPMFKHGQGPQFAVTTHTESSGTKALFRSLAAYKWVLDTGGVLICDEFDIHLHPHILPKLVDLFVNEEINKKKAQFIFTTHSAEIMNQLGRYRTYLVNKQDNESFAYRLDELPGDILRNDRPILTAYNDGKIGGIPKL